MFASSGESTPRTQRETSSLSERSRAGGELQCLTCVARGNMFTAYVSIVQSGKGPTAERGARPASRAGGATRGSTAFGRPVWFVTAASLSIPGRSGPTRRAGRSGRSNGTGYDQAPTDHGARAADVCTKQRPDYRRHRHPRTGGLSDVARKAWLTGRHGAVRFKFISSMRLIGSGNRGWPKPTTSWCRNENASSAGG